MQLPRELIASILAFGITASLPGVRANTEIVNFEASFGPDTPIPRASEWLSLNPTNDQTLLHVLPAPLGSSIGEVCEPLSLQSLRRCPHEAWLAVDLDKSPWSSYSRFTLRISWPTSYPTDFFIDLYSPESLGAALYDGQGVPPRGASDTASTRTKFARIRLISDGVLTPSPSNQNRTIEPVPCIVIVEPLYLGVVPASLVPTLLFLFGLVGITGFVALPRISKHLFAIADRIRVEHAKKYRTQ
ncbi:hypothetical protein C2E23DRAFT_818407 [Lenzites betulinus]|nr:hypothetical protein C2E23DRAFT_818407 [Lenzites betulinus]